MHCFSAGKGNRNSNKNPRSVWKQRQKKDSTVRKKRKRTERNAPYSSWLLGEEVRCLMGMWCKQTGVFKDEPGKFLVGNLEMFAQCISQERERSKWQRHTALNIRTFWESVSFPLWSEAEKWLSIFRSSQVYVMQWDWQDLERGCHGLFDFWKEAARLSLDLGNTECKGIFSDINSSRSMIVLLQCGKRSERVRAAEQ